jgi:hypothetical protein
MSFTTRIQELIEACFTGLWIETQEPSEALLELAQLSHAQQWRMVHWNLESGLSLQTEATATAQDPLAVIRSLSSLHSDSATTLLVLENFHRFLQSTEIIQALIQQIHLGKQQRTFIVIMAPVINLPIELDKLLIVIEHELPNREQLTAIAQQMATETSELPTGRDFEQVLDAAAGLTRYEAEGAFSLSLVRHGKLQPAAIWSIKAGLLKKSGLLQLYRGTENFDQLGGLTALKAFCRRALLQSKSGAQRPRPKGVLLVSPPGCGKSAFCKALGQETGRPVLQLDVGTLLGSLVGQSEERMRQALKIANAMAPCVLMIDEVEKALAGVTGSQGDSGVSSRLFGTLLTWLNDHTSDVFVVCTANDVSRLPPEFARAERFDGIFMVDLPGPTERAAIWQMYLQQYQLDPQQPRPTDEQWTGAEIKACCRLAALLDLPLQQAAQHIVPVAVTAAEAVAKLRTWASGRCLSADQPGIYQANNAATTRRKVTRSKHDPNNN